PHGHNLAAGRSPVAAATRRRPAVPYGSVSRLESLKQTGRYSCRAENRLGAAEHTFRLVQPTVPEAPTDVRLAKPAGWDHLALAWRRVRRRVSGEDIRQRDRQDPSRVVLNSSQRSDANTRCNITDLLPNTNYSLNVYAVNSLGRGPPSQSLEVRTAHWPCRSPADLGGYCLKDRVLDDGGSSWSTVHVCLASDKPELPNVSSRLLYRASLCLTHRPEVCGQAVLSSDGGPVRFKIYKEDIWNPLGDFADASVEVVNQLHEC
uniref:Fibronectin type-III domain-containing protein n=1 Tax=Macrostomum lignano TaxID=282301 RepID=A0A1I8JQ62_9PLAT